MYFRIKKKYRNPFDKGVISVGPGDFVPAGAWYEGERKLINSEHGQDIKAWTKAMLQLKKAHDSKTIKPDGDESKQFAILSHQSFLAIPLRHGDLVVMDGTGLQKYYEVR